MADTSYHPKNLYQSDKVESFLTQLGQSKVGQSLKMIDDDEIVIIDLTLLENMKTLKANYEKALAKLEEISPEHKQLLETAGLLVEFSDPIIQAIPKNKKVNKIKMVSIVTGLFTQNKIKLEVLGRVDWEALNVISNKYELVKPK